MTLFPFFMNLEKKRGVITGGGRHALEKVEKMLPYGPKLTLYAEVFSEELQAHPEISRVNRRLQEADLEELPAFVIAAGEDAEENHRIAGWCREKRIPVNVVDDPEYCDFIFPSLIARGNLSVGICTNGASPATGIFLRKKMEEQIPEKIEEILDFLQEKRPAINQAFENKKQRFSVYYELSELCMSLKRPLTEPEFNDFIKSNT